MREMEKRMTSKVCTCCKIEFSLDSYYKRPQAKDGKCSICKSCMKKKSSDYRKKNIEKVREKNKIRCKRFYENNKEKLSEYSKEYRRLNKEKISDTHKKYYRENKEKIKAYRKEYYLKNKEKELSRNRKYASENKGICNAVKVKYHASKIQACPNWADMDLIQTVYDKAQWLSSLTGLTYHVDHLVPLQGENVCGLHVWENLQILEASINCSKRNTLTQE